MTELDWEDMQVEMNAEEKDREWRTLRIRYGDKRWSNDSYEDERVEEHVEAKYQYWMGREEAIARRFYAGMMWEELSPLVRQHVREVFVRENYENIEGVLCSLMSAAWRFENSTMWSTREQVRNEVQRREHAKMQGARLSMEQCWSHGRRGGCDKMYMCRFCHVGPARRVVY